MNNLTLQEGYDIQQKTTELENKFPMESMSGSRASVWGAALRGGLIDEELYRQARQYYGRLWNYSGD